MAFYRKVIAGKSRLFNFSNALSRFETEADVSDVALRWFSLVCLCSLSFRFQRFRKSSCRVVTGSVPQGLILSPLLFCIYTRLLEFILQKHDTSYQFDVEDTYCNCLLIPKKLARQSIVVLLISDHVYQRTS